jgi:hypothetical protein
MPYYFGEGDPGWDEYMEDQERAFVDRKPFPRPLKMFAYIEPEQAKTTVLTFPREPVHTEEEPAAADSTDWLANYHRDQARTAARGLARVAMAAATLRSTGVARVHGRYHGGSDESFTDAGLVEMRDGRQLMGQGGSVRGLVESAVDALMGHYGAGPFELYGAVVIDCDACTITDVKDQAITFGDYPKDD